MRWKNGLVAHSRAGRRASRRRCRGCGREVTPGTGRARSASRCAGHAEGTRSGLERAKGIATRLRAALLTADADALTSPVAQIRIPTGAAGTVRNIDVLHMPLTVGGLRKSREFTPAVWHEGVEIEWKPGHRIRVMHTLPTRWPLTGRASRRVP
jgi:hypothetical protein